MRKLLRSMAKAAMREAGIEKMFKGKTFANLWRKYATRKAELVRKNLCKSPKISKGRRKSKMRKRIESLVADREVQRVLARVAR